MANSFVTNPACFRNPLNNEVAAYFIGLIMADGCVSTNDKGKPRNVQLSLLESDRIVIDRLNDFLGGKYKVSTRTNKNSYSPLSRSAAICFASRTVLDDLERFGVTARKTNNAIFREGVQHCRHTWRGMIDGDGWVGFISTEKTPRPAIGLISSKFIAKQFADFTRTIAPSYRGNPVEDKGPRVPVWRVTVTGRHAVSLANELYRDATVWLPRKSLAAERFATWVPHWGKHK